MKCMRKDISYIYHIIEKGLRWRNGEAKGTKNMDSSKIKRRRKKFEDKLIWGRRSSHFSTQGFSRTRDSLKSFLISFLYAKIIIINMHINIYSFKLFLFYFFMRKSLWSICAYMHILLNFFFKFLYMRK